MKAKCHVDELCEKPLIKEIYNSFHHVSTSKREIFFKSIKIPF